MATAQEQAGASSQYLYYRLFEEAEKVRWRMRDIPWSDVEEDKVDLTLLDAVREAVKAEFTTYSATRAFMDLFRDDVDFTQWLAVWLYEETKHPHVYMNWLRRFGVEVPRAAMLAERSIQPMMDSRIGMLGINIISEIVACQSYLALANSTREPVLHHIAQLVGADESRHSSHFFSYARQLLQNSADRQADERIILRVLYMWLTDPYGVKHPGNLTFAAKELRYDSTGGGAAYLAFDMPSLQQRVCNVFGMLLDRDEMNTIHDVRQELQSMRTSRRRLH